ncbi:MAG: VanW family protein [Clostridiales bacterium]|nr:VanW family protein [Clostridiales bacterium]
MKKNRRKLIKVLGITIGVLFLAVIGLSAAVIASSNDSNTITTGVYINDLSVGGMTKEEAEKALSAYIEKTSQDTLVLKAGKKTVEATLADLGFSCEENNFVEEAYNLGKTGNIISRYKTMKDIEKEQKVFELEFSLDDEKLEKFVKKSAKKYDKKAVNASMERSNGTFEITDGKEGSVVSQKDTIEKIKVALADDWSSKEDGLQIDAVIVTEEPAVTRDMLEECTDLLGSYNTSYGTSSNSRANNVANAAKLINGTILAPGEEFSATEKLVPFTQDNGYQTAGAYANGQVVDSIGGGVCQAVTTLYNAVLLSELEVTERYNHSMIVSYVKPSMDAAVAEGSKDFKFKNNTSAPVYINSWTSGRTIFFEIYGKETREDNRKVEYISEVTETIQPGADKVTEDPNKPEGYLEVTQSAHTGYKARLWKVVYVDGKEVSREQVNSSYYKAEPRYVIKGTKKPEEPEKPDEKKEDTTKKENDTKKETSGDTKKEDKKETSPEETSEKQEKDNEPEESEDVNNKG